MGILPMFALYAHQAQLYDIECGSNFPVGIITFVWQNYLKYHIIDITIIHHSSQVKIPVLCI